MSFNFKKSAPAANAAALKAAVQAESAPQQVKDELCRRIDATAGMMGDGKYYGTKCVIIVSAQGHLETTAEGALTMNNASLPVFSVEAVPFLDTPLANEAPGT